MKLDRKGPSIIARYYPWLVWFVCNGMPLQPVWDQGVGWLFLEQATTRLRYLVWWLKDCADAGFFKRFSTIWLETLTRIQILGYPDIIRYPIFRHLLDPHLVLEQLRTKPSLFGIRGYKGSHGLNMA